MNAVHGFCAELAYDYAVTVAFGLMAFELLRRIREFGIQNAPPPKRKTAFAPLRCV